MMNILIVSNNDACRSRMAMEILTSFGRVYSMKLLLLRQVLTQTVQRFFVGSLPMKKMQLSKSNILKN